MTYGQLSWKCCIDRRMAKQTVVDPHTKGMLLRRGKELLIHATMWISLKASCWVKEVRNTGIHIAWFQCYEVLEYVILICGEENQNSGCLWGEREVGVRTDQEGVAMNSLKVMISSLMSVGVSGAQVYAQSHPVAHLQLVSHLLKFPSKEKNSKL